MFPIYLWYTISPLKYSAGERSEPLNINGDTTPSGFGRLERKGGCLGRNAERISETGLVHIALPCVGGGDGQIDEHESGRGGERSVEDVVFLEGVYHPRVKHKLSRPESRGKCPDYS
jgi:hypothetical protein